MGPARHESVTSGCREMPHVVQISFFSDRQGRTAEQLLDEWPTLVEVAESASKSGSDVSVVLASARSEHLEFNCVHYFLRAGGGAAARGAGGAGGRGGRRGRA